MKSESISGIEIVFHKLSNGHIEAGFKKRPYITSGRTKEIALENMKQIMKNIQPVVLRMYKKDPRAMVELEDI